MCSGGDLDYSPGQGSSSYPTPAPSPAVDSKGVPLPPATPRSHSIQLPQRSFVNLQPRLHPLLSYANRPRIVYDIRERPSSASASRARLEWARESATNPPSSQVIITCQVFPRPFVVRPSGRDYNFVTVHDILAAVHCAFKEVIWIAGNRCNLASQRGGQDETARETTLLFGRLSRGLSVRYMWKGLSEEISPGNWLLHIE